VEDVFAEGEPQAMPDRYKVLTGMKKRPSEAKP